MLFDFLRKVPIWQVRVAVAGHSNTRDMHLRPLLIQWAGMAKQEVRSRRDAQTAESRNAFRKWVDEQLRTGAGALHAIARRTDPPIEAAVYTHAAKTQQVLEAEFAIAKAKRDKKSAPRSGQTVASASERGAHGGSVGVAIQPAVLARKGVG